MNKIGYIIIDKKGHDLEGNRYEVGKRYHPSRPPKAYLSLMDAVIIYKRYNNAEIAKVMCFGVPDKDMIYEATDFSMISIMSASSMYLSLVEEHETKQRSYLTYRSNEDGYNRLYFKSNQP